jgi:TetR/AcrR family transcriptional regulator, copper-responsive repressor
MFFRQFNAENRALLQRLLAMNIEAEKPRMAPSAIAEMVLSFFSGLCIERKLKSGKTSSTSNDPKSAIL